MKLKGKRALVTGAAKRIGAAIAQGLALEGCRLVLHYHRSRKDIETLARKIEKGGGSVEILRADLEKETEVSNLARNVLKKDPVDILVNNASVYFPTPLGKISSKDWDRILAVNLKAPFLLAQKLGPRMRRGGCIINLTDDAGNHPYLNYLPYCISKSGLLSLTRALALELAPKVRVNSVSPGAIVPPPWQSRRVIESIRKGTPLQAWGGEEEIVKAVLFLCLSDFTTGADIIVDGGYQLV